jgi:RNA polymerase sigma-70 factor (ECF subfamily)
MVPAAPRSAHRAGSLVGRLSRAVRVTTDGSGEPSYHQEVQDPALMRCRPSLIGASFFTSQAQFAGWGRVKIGKQPTPGQEGSVKWEGKGFVLQAGCSWDTRIDDRGSGRRAVEPQLTGKANVALTAADRGLLQRCLHHEPGAWNDFVDRFLGLIYHVIHHTAHLRSAPLRPEDTEDVAAEVLLGIVAKDYQVLRQFRGQSSLATYLTVIARRICVHELARRAAAREVQPKPDGHRVPEMEIEEPPRAEVGLESLEEVQKLLARLPSRERAVVRFYYLEGRTYEEIATELNIPVNSIGPILSRARKKMRKGVANPPPVHRPKTQEKN